jgi:hypothetical protein
MDSQCLSYLIDAIMEVADPKDSLADEKKALFRIYLYLPDTLYVTPTVQDECAAIRNTDRRKLHDDFISTMFGELFPEPKESISFLTREFAKYHGGANDCRILAEAEIAGMGFLLTYDGVFLERLKSRTKCVNLIRPSEMWAQLHVPRGAKPDKSPHLKNPLSKEAWWKW